MLLTERDREIIRLVLRSRFLRSWHLFILEGGSEQAILRRLALLYHHGYLDRPRAQLDYYHRGGSHRMVYGLGRKGIKLLARELDDELDQHSHDEQYGTIGRIYLAHALLVSEIMVAFELACRKRGDISFIPQEKLTPADTHDVFRWRVTVQGGMGLGVIPDQVFAVEFTAQSGSWDRQVFFLEADRGTMPVVRRSLSQTSFYRKLLAYEATWAQSIHRRRFGFHRFRVLTVTTNARRIESMVNACAQLKRGHGLFLFADQSILANPAAILSVNWQTGTPGTMTRLLD